MRKKLFVIAVTGAPMSGKSMLIENSLDILKLNYDINCSYLSETATELFLTGIDHSINKFVFQENIYELQKHKEDLIRFFLEKDNTDILFVDRGLADGAAYIESEEFQRILDANFDTFESIFARYDCVIQLQAYSNLGVSPDNSSNPVRYEKEISEVLNLEKKLKKIYGYHENYNFIPSTEDINEKQELFIQTVLENYERFTRKNSSD